MDANPVRVSVRQYEWGTLRTISRGVLYACVIHPEHVQSIRDAEPFTDEQAIPGMSRGSTMPRSHSPAVIGAYPPPPTNWRS